MELKNMGYWRILALVLIAAMLSVIYSFVMGVNLFVGFFAMLLAVFGSYYVLMSLIEEDTIKLRENERMFVRTLNGGSVIFPREKGGLLGRGKKTHRNLDIYLTSERIIAKNPKSTVLSLPLSAIESIDEENKLMVKYLRATYIVDEGEKEVLLFVGNTDLWMKRLAQTSIADKVEDKVITEDKTTDILTEDKTIDKAMEKLKKLI